MKEWLECENCGAIEEEIVLFAYIYGGFRCERCGYFNSLERKKVNKGEKDDSF